MTIYDPSRRELVVRLVYDGPGRAGKSTNLAMLADRYKLPRPTEFATGDGKSTLFDWVDLRRGRIAGARVRFQLVATPGQLILGRAREHILKSADAIVFVCDATLSNEHTILEMIASLREALADRAETTPIVLQANKQDLPGALSPERVRRKLGLPRTTPCLRSQATEGLGVRETLSRALALCNKQLDATIREHGIESLSGTVETGRALRDTLLSLDPRARGASPPRPPLVPPRVRSEPVSSSVQHILLAEDTAPELVSPRRPTLRA
ncbi:MAG: hypothetical protein KC468_24100, partial [Myxococcales bacterium]|nr:hypothetical protein [Myxococcales bacterium]